jgi:hypothetical protein
MFVAELFDSLTAPEGNLRGLLKFVQELCIAEERKVWFCHPENVAHGHVEGSGRMRQYSLSK